MNASDKTQYSNFLSHIARRFSSQIEDLPSDNEAALSALTSSIAQLPFDDSFAQSLRELKALFAYRWAIARLEQALPAAKLGQLQTLFAEQTIAAALRCSWSNPAIAKLLQTKPCSQAEDIPGLFILGLGKLGGYDLNFSSDVDLIAFYDAEQLPVAAMHGRGDVCNRVLKVFTQLLSKSSEGLFVWRVDWRLRPNASTMSLCMSTDIAEDFYYFHSQPWQRLAMIKARPIAGDLQAGSAFINLLEPYLWRQNLDFQMVDEIQRLKHKINLEHPQLKQSRTSGQLHKLDECEGFNLKLGRGGIREIEFIVNATQLLWGGKKPSLRLTTTTDLLNAISEANLMHPNDAQQLGASYTHLRWLEDATQILDNAQTHALPTDTLMLDNLLKITNTSDEQSLYTKLQTHREHTAHFFDTLFSPTTSSDSNQTTETFETPSWLETIPNAQQAIFNAWANGFDIYLVSPDQADSLKPLYNYLCQLLSEDNINRSQAIEKLHAFFNAIPKGGQYLRLLAEHASLLKSIAIPLIHSPHMTHLLEQSPHIVDHLLEPETKKLVLDQSQFDSEFVLQSSDFETRLERLRRFVNEQLYCAYLQLINGDISSGNLQTHLTALAEHSLYLGIQITNAEMRLSESPIAIIGMGKLGMAAMSPMSDLDLIFVSDDDTDLELANEYSKRLQHLMSLRTREGRAYEMDMRLRPSGNAGPVTVSLQGFSHYQNNRAKTWEHIALCAGRAITGPESLMQNISETRSSILARPRNKEQLALDAAKMFWRIQTQHIGKSNPAGIDVKYHSGGLMELDYLCACICLLVEPANEISHQSYDKMVKLCANKAGNRSDLQAYSTMIPSENLLDEATHFWRNLQTWTRILGLNELPISQLNPALAEKLLHDMQQPSTPLLLEKMDSISHNVHQLSSHMQALFEANKPDNWDDWQETPVQWLN